MLYAINREGDPADILYTEDVAAMLGVTVHTLHKLADVGRAPKPIAKVGARNVYRRAGIWSFMTRSNAGKAKTGRCRASQCGGTGTVGRNGLCPRHRNAYEVLGDAALALVLPIVRRSATLAEKVAANVVTEPTTACLIWIGARCSDGYGSVKDASGRTVAVHRAAFEIALGRPIADLMEPDHECGQRACVLVGPGHIVEVSRSENMRRMAERKLSEQEAYSQGRLTLDPDLLGSVQDDELGAAA